MSVEEARRVTASFSGRSFIAPPRTIRDITAILDQQKPADPQAVAAARARADQPPPVTDARGRQARSYHEQGILPEHFLPGIPSEATLADFYHQRGLAAREIGRTRQEIEDLTKAVGYAERSMGAAEHRILYDAYFAELRGGNFSRAVAFLRRAIDKVPRGQEGTLMGLYAILAVGYARMGDLAAAEGPMKETLTLFYQSGRWPNPRPEWVAGYQANAAGAQAAVREAKGQFDEAEAFYRRAVAALEGDPVQAKSTWLDVQRAFLAQVLVRQGRLLEAENDARKALLGALSKAGRYSTHTAFILKTLIRVLSEQGRYPEAETLARASLDIYEKTGASGDSLLLAATRLELGIALGGQGRWRDAAKEYEAVALGLAGDPVSTEKFLKGKVDVALALLHTGQLDRASEMLTVALERSRHLVGEKHAQTAEIHGLLAVAHAARGDHRQALSGFAAAVPGLTNRSLNFDDETTTPVARDQRLGLILTSYIALLAEVTGTALEREAGVDAAAEAFRLADVVRGRSVQRALDASAARASVKTPVLADLVRREQDARKQLGALNGLLANVLSTPSDQQNPKVAANLRSQIDALGRARESLTAEIEKEFPAYAELLNPRPASVDQVRAVLRPGEALLATLVSDDRTFVWAIPETGPVAFAVTPVGTQALRAAVATLRRAVDPGAQVVGDIPPFDVALAHELYRWLLEPVKAGWQDAENLLVVPHGPLGQLPFAALPTKPTTLGPEQAPLFSNYRAVPWLARTHAVTTLPSVTALRTLRALAPGDRTRRAFVGFGDPYFSREQARRAAEQRPSAEVAALTPRALRLTLRDLKIVSLDSAPLAILPRLPDTADEIRSIAVALDADLARDVFLGERANEHAVKTLDLSGYRVIAFATHGLVPGDLDGLDQPALAMTAPEVANVDGDGLLTMEEILGLRLNADWVVLSACNTASGNGAGSEAISGLGRAFFYAGARALLVSNWPVETTSARLLTTDLFRRQSARPRLSGAKALQQTIAALMDGPGLVDPRTNQVLFSYVHPIFWAPFTLVGDGAASARVQSLE